MQASFQPLFLESLKESPFTLIGSDWMLITAGPLGRMNMMTASWGGLGVLWNLNVAFCFVRPTRHTFQFMEEARHYTLSFFEEAHRSILDFCGNHSGRDLDKVTSTGLNPVEVPPGAVTFAQARLALVCRKVYTQDLDPSRFLDPAIHGHYPKKDYHRMYVGEIVECLENSRSKGRRDKA